jgi:hypothetical protein
LAEAADPLEIWPSEAIPDDDRAFVRVHEAYLRAGGDAILPGVFQNKPTTADGMSCNWNKYCPTPKEAQEKAREPKRNAVIVAPIGLVRAVVGQTVVHTPVQRDKPSPDRSHADVFGEKTTEVRAKLSTTFTWALRINRPPTEVVG